MLKKNDTESHLEWYPDVILNNLKSHIEKAFLFQFYFTLPGPVHHQHLPTTC